jgi:hypothetical protein
MTEDRGAFKTNQVNLGQISAFCDYRRVPLQRSRTEWKTFAGVPAAIHVGDIWQPPASLCGSLKAA